MMDGATQGMASKAVETRNERGPRRAVPAVPAVPAQVGRYEIRDALGAGAMGIVYRAHDPDLHREVAIKLVRDNRPQSGNHLLREAQALAKLRHPNVVPIFDVGAAGDHVFVAMPLIEGGTLRSWLGARPRSLDEILDRFLAAGRGLSAAHAAGLVHRDVKPDNVLIGSGGEVLVADFGLARLADGFALPDPSADQLIPGALTQVGTVVGTPAYMAPEQLRGRRIHARADQFSFCVALWEATYGARPFRDPPSDAGDPLPVRIDAIAAGPPRPPRRDRPGWLGPLLARGLAASPAHRWPSLEALLDAIAAHRAHRRWPRWLAAAAATAIALVAAILALTRTAPASERPVHAPIPLALDKGSEGAAPSPDGRRVAIIRDGALVIRESEYEVTIIADGVTGPVSWSPDNEHLLVGVIPRTPGAWETEWIELATGVRSHLPVIGTAVFVSATEIAVVRSYRSHSVAFYRVGDYAAPASTCDVPGDYTFLWRVLAVPGGPLVVETQKVGERFALATLDARCELRPVPVAESFTDVATTDTGNLVVLVPHPGLDEILELSLSGTVVSRRLVGAALGRVLGRRHDIDYVTTLAPTTELVQIHDHAPRRHLAIHARASFYLAPGADTLAWIERDDHVDAPGRLRWSLSPFAAQPATVLHNALTAGWSPDGRWLAVLTAVTPPLGAAAPDASPPRTLEVLLVERTAARRPGRQRPVALRDLDPDAAPVWLDARRLAARASDRITYRWIDVDTGRTGALPFDPKLGSTLWLARSPVDGMLAMWRIGDPGAHGSARGRLWLQRADGTARPLDVDDTSHFLVPSWSPSGQLLVRAYDTGAVSLVALDTGKLTPIAELAPTPLGRLSEDHLNFLPGGDLLAASYQVIATVAAVGPTAGPAPDDR